MTTVYYYNTAIDNDDVLQEIRDDYSELPDSTIRALIQSISEGEEIVVADYPDNLQADIEDFIQYLTTKPIVEVPAETTEPKESPEALIGAAVVAPLGEKFLLQSDGSIAINKDSLPSLEEAHDTFLGFYNMARLTEVAKDKAAWLLGEFIVACENHFGENFNPSQVIDITEKAYNTLYQAARIVRMFPPDSRKPQLSYSHHREIGMTKGLDEDARQKILDKAADLDLNTRDTRSLCSIVKDQGDQALDEVSDSESIRQIKDEIADKKEVFIYEAKPDLWKKTTRKTTEAPPEGIRVINLNQMKLFKDGLQLEISKE